MTSQGHAIPSFSGHFPHGGIPLPEVQLVRLTATMTTEYFVLIDVDRPVQFITQSLDKS